MAVTEQTPYITHNANGVTTVFAFPFLVLDESDLDVEVLEADLDPVVISYTVSGIGNPSGGSVTFSSAPPNLGTVSLRRVSQLARSTNYATLGDLKADTLNDDLDRLWLALQEVDASSGVAPTAAALAADLANTTAAGKNAALVGYNPALAYASGIGRFLNFIHARTADEIAASITPTNYAFPPGDPRRYGAAGDCTGAHVSGVWGGTNDQAAVQAAVNALPEGGELLITRPYRLSSTVTINKPITVRGTGAGSALNGAVKAGIYPDASVKAFTLVARQANYAFSQYGIVGVHFKELYCPGGNNTSGFVTVDKTVNSGDFHVTLCTFTDCNWRYHNIGVELTGIAYLNTFTRNNALWNTSAVVIERGAASVEGGQTRFFGGYYGLNVDAIKLNVDANAAGGSFGFHGVTISENTGIGLQFDEECNIYMSPDCEIENNSTCGIYCEIKEANPTVAGQKRIGGKFISNGGGVTDIWINKTTSAFSGGGFHFPFKIDDAYLGGSASLRVDVPSGHAPIDSPAFILGRNIAGPSGEVSSSQISANFAGTDERKGPYFKRWVIPTSYVSGTVFAYLPFGLVASVVRVYFTANCSSFSSISLGDQGSGTRYLSGINGQSVSLNAWQTATISPPQLVIDNTNNALRLAGTAGWLSAAAVVEVQGYVT